MYLKHELERYVPWNEQEEKDREIMLDLLAREENLFTRENRTAHFTASAWVVSKDRQKVLMAYHNIFHSWAWLGGHADGEEDLLKVALKEVKEESDCDAVPLSREIYSIEIIHVAGHMRKGEYVSGHVHLNVTYLLEADEHQILHHREGENTRVGWFPAEQVYDVVEEPWVSEWIYRKLNSKLKEYV